MVDTLRHRDWFEKSKKDLQGAAILFEHDADNGIVCFLCQQAIEKALKGFLICATGSLQDGHSLIKLCKRAEGHHPLFADMTRDMAFVNIYYIETRYPSEDPLIVSEQDARACLEIAISLAQTIEGLADDLIHHD